MGLSIDDPVWDVTVFTKNRERLLKGEVAQGFLRAVVEQPGRRACSRTSISPSTARLSKRGPDTRASSAKLTTGRPRRRAYVTDAISCLFLGTVTGGGSTFCPVVFNGSEWVGC